KSQGRDGGRRAVPLSLFPFFKTPLWSSAFYLEIFSGDGRHHGPGAAYAYPTENRRSTTGYRKACISLRKPHRKSMITDQSIPATCRHKEFESGSARKAFEKSLLYPALLFLAER
ncbi:MAG: hypothetical protein VXY90_01470, partial [Pseudomonadota bacterium]|nr:hypothetical protein [Pseudomonadota bacterium]